MSNSDLTLYKLSFDTQGYMREFERYLDIALTQLSFSIQELMRKEIISNGNGTHQMRETAAAQVKEISRTISGGTVELVVGIDESTLGGFSDEIFTRTMVVLHGNVTSGPLMTKPGKPTWKKGVRGFGTSKATTVYFLPQSFSQYEMVNGFGSGRNMLNNIFDNQAKHVIKDFYDLLSQLVANIDCSKFLSGG